MHVPVWIEMAPFEKIDIEAQLTGYSNAGCITFVELDAAWKYNIDAVEGIVNYSMDKDIPYFAINVPNDQCMQKAYKEIGRKITTFEYQKVVDKALQLGLTGFIQEKGSADEMYLPDFDLTGVL